MPPLMSDSRQFTNFDPNCEANNKLKKSLNLQTNYDYRQYLIKNGMSVINKNNNCALKTNINNVIGNGGLINHNKYIFNNVFDNNRPFGYEGSDLKNIYLSRQQLQARMDAPFVKMN
tara:strand:+ start:134 stop:484 length:351 start_codon:yes stop_codon:yes gene_type:complete